MCECILCILALFCPPLAILCHRGCGNDFWINVILTLLVWVPGVIHAWYVICCAPDLQPMHTTVHIHHTDAGAGGYAPPPYNA